MLPSNGPGTRSSLLALIAALGLALAACRDPNANVQTDAPPDCALVGPPHVAHDGTVLLYAMTDLTIDPSDDPDVPHTGFDLDGFASGDSDPGGCEHLDYRSALDPDQNCAAVGAEHCTRFSPRCNCIASLDLSPASMGQPPPCFGSVDNQFPTAANTIQTEFNVDIHATAPAAVNAGRLVLLVRVTGVDAFDNDPSVHVQLFRGFASPRTPCTVPMPGGTYQIERASLRSGGTTPNDSAVDLLGSIHDGRLRVVGTDTESFTLLWPFASATSLALPSHHVTLAMDITHDAATRGNFGAWVTGADAVTTFTPLTPPDGVNILPGVVGGLADIEADGICGDRPTTPPTFGAISIGFGFDAVRVQLDATNPVVDGPMPGTCAFVGAVDAGHD